MKKLPCQSKYDANITATDASIKEDTMNKQIAVTINETALRIKEYKNQRVVTFREVDTVHGRPDGTAKRTFRANKDHMIDGVDYFKVCADEIRTRNILELSPKAHEDIVLLTESGYLMLVKSFTDDLAWTVQRQLVNTYFRATSDERRQAAETMRVLPQDYPAALRALADQVEQNNKLAQTVEVQRQAIADFQPLKQYVDTILSSTRTMTTTQIAADYDLTAHRLNKILHEDGVQRKVGGQWILYEKHMGKGYTKSRTIPITRRDGRDDSVVQTEWTQKGRLFIHNILTARGIVAVMDRNKTA